MSYTTKQLTILNEGDIVRAERGDHAVEGPMVVALSGNNSLSDWKNPTFLGASTHLQWLEDNGFTLTPMRRKPVELPQGINALIELDREGVSTFVIRRLNDRRWIAEEYKYSDNDVEDFINMGYKLRVIFEGEK